MKKKTRAVVVHKKSPSISIGGIDININSVLTTAFGALIMFSVNRGCAKSDESTKASEQTQMKVEMAGEKLTNVSAEVKDVKSDVKAVQNDVQNLRATSVTKAELTANHQDLQQSIGKVWDRVGEVSRSKK